MDDRDAAKDTARDLAEIATHIGQLKGDASADLTNPDCNTLKLSGWRVHILRWRLLLWRPGGG
jgi:hypothetical protein